MERAVAASLAGAPALELADLAGLRLEP